MKTILAATDFTQAAHNACVYAAALAKEYKARLILFSAYQPLPFPPTEVPLGVIIEDIKSATELELRKAVSALQLLHNDIEIETMSSEGPAVNEIIIAAKEIGADIIVIGMKDHGKGFRKVFGSTVTTLARKSLLPLLVVPEGAGFVKLNTIALANDHDANAGADQHLLDMLRDLGERFSSKLYLVRIVKNQFQESYETFNRPLRLAGMVKSLNPVYECFEGRVQEKALNQFIMEHDIDMLALLPHYHSMADRLFSKSTTRSMIFESQVPLLILPGYLHPPVATAF
jgi:nucleotide-binding universal stress UspA family protein